LDAHLSTLEKSIIPEMVIGIGAAITGIIAIAFSLSLFAIQQVADRGTPATVQAYARDRVMTLIYWALAVLAIACFAVALLKPDTSYRTVTVAVGLLSLFLSFILLNFHFRRVVKFSDPRYTVSRIYSRGEKQLKILQKLRERIVPKGPGGTKK
jgi:H+/Cl- antiporter ClcA